MAAAAAQHLPASRFISLTAISAVLFFISLVPTEMIPEIPVDIDFKPYFLPLLLVALLPVGRPTLAVALGVALGEGLRDLMEGYEIDDPIGFFGYIVGFLVAGYVIGVRPLNRLVLFVGAVIGAGAQAVIEASSFILFGEEGIDVAAATAVGNTITHGVILGGIPLMFLAPALHGRFERYLGFAPKGTPAPRQSLEQLAGQDGAKRNEEAGGTGALVSVRDLWFRFHGGEEPQLRGVNLSIEGGESLGVLGPSGAGTSTLALALAAVAPRDTGGEILGEVRVDGCDITRSEPHQAAEKVGLVTESAQAQITHVSPVEEVAAALMNRGRARDAAVTEARDWLRRVGLPEELHERRSWELSEGEQRIVILAATLAPEPPLLILDGVLQGLDEPGRQHLRRLLDETGHARAVLIAEKDPDLLLEWTDRVTVLQQGRILREGAPAEILGDSALMGRLGFERPLRCRPGEDRAAASAMAGPVTAEQDLAPGPGEKMLDVTKLCYGYGSGPRAIDDVGLDLAAGEILAVVGRNGAGKTTLAKLIVGLLQPASGEIRIAGRDVAGMPFAERAGLVGLAMADPDQSLSERTVLQEIAFPLRRAGLARDEARATAIEVARRTGISESCFEKDPTALSLGQRKQVVIAAALARAPKLLLLDEPGAGLDGAERRALLDALGRLKAEGVSIILFDHSPELAAEAAERAVLLKHGRVAARGAPRAIFDDGWRRLEDPGVARLRAADPDDGRLIRSAFGRGRTFPTAPGRA